MVRELWRGIALALALVGCPKLASAAEPALGFERERASVLADHLDRASALAALEPYLPAIGGTLCAGGAVALAVADINEFHASRAAVVAPAAGCAVASFGSYLLPREYQGSIVLFSTLTAASAPLALSALENPYLPRAERITMLGFVGGTMSIGALRLVDALMERPVSWTAMKADARKLREGEVSRLELARMEADYRRATVRPVPRWAYGASMLASGAVALSPAFMAGTSKTDRFFAASFSGILFLNGGIGLAVALAVPDGYRRYERALAGVQLTPIGPANAAGLWGDRHILTYESFEK